MKKSSCMKLTIGVESGDQFILDKVIDKNLKLENVIKLAKICKKVRIPLSAFYVIGFPGEKKENIERTIKFALMLQKNIGLCRGVLFMQLHFTGQGFMVFAESTDILLRK